MGAADARIWRGGLTFRTGARRLGDTQQIRDASTIIVLRDAATAPRVLMGQRGAKAAFMPNKFVFPGGAVDAGDAHIPFEQDLTPENTAALTKESARAPQTLAAAAIRELWEETGQILGHPAHWPDAPQGWRSFGATGHRPNAAPLDFVFRAVTPKGRTRRFDARFFLADAAALTSDPDDFSRAEDELNHLQWVPLDEARTLDLPFITEVVLAELSQRLRDGTTATTIPFFRNDDEAHLVTRLAGKSPLDP